MVELENEQEREAQENAVGCYGLYGLQYSLPAHHFTTQNFPISTKKKNGERKIEIATLNYKQKKKKKT